VTRDNVIIAPADLNQLDALMELEDQCFSFDRISRRSMRRFITNDQCILLVARRKKRVAGYLLIIFYRGTKLARLYSIAVTASERRQGIATKLIDKGEQSALERGSIHLRLETGQNNSAAVRLFQKLEFQEFGLLEDYYQDHSSAIRMQKRIRHPDPGAVHTNIPWIRQHTSFTCGPAALLMAMKGLDRSFKPDLSEELQIWRETTTIFMTSGHGGCHPLGLALAAHRRGFRAEAWINKSKPLFTEGVRNSRKKQIISTVHSDFVEQAAATGITIHSRAFDLQALRSACDNGAVPIVLISTYRLDWKKAPHWVVVTGYDQRCFYVHDPDYDEEDDQPRDLQDIPIANEDFGSMTTYGSSRLRCAIIISR